MEKKYCTAVVLAGGSGKRMGTKVHKQYLMLKGYPVLYYSLKAFQDSSWIDEIVLVSDAGEEEYCQKEIVEKYGFSKVHKIVAGGAERYNSVWNGLQQIKEKDGFVYIHDGARPFVDDAMIERCLSMCGRNKCMCCRYACKGYNQSRGRKELCERHTGAKNTLACSDTTSF